MKLIGTINGWAVAPQCWRRFLFLPLQIERTPGWISVSVFGVVWFFARKENQ